jgi:hypothetical protein
MENKEEQIDLKRQRSTGEAIREMASTRGWLNEFRPMLIEKRKALMRGLLNATEQNDFISSQQAINTIDYALSWVENAVEIGKQAAETLELQKESARQEIVDGS